MEVLDGIQEEGVLAPMVGNKDHASKAEKQDLKVETNKMHT